MTAFWNPTRPAAGADHGGAGLPLFWAPIANASLSAARPHEQGQASGTAAAVRELAIVLGIAVLASTFVAHGSYTSPTAFIGGLWLAAGLADRAARHPARSAIDRTGLERGLGAS